MEVALFVGMVVIAAIIAYFKGNSDGASKERAKKDEARSEAIDDRREIDAEVDALSPADVDAEFERMRKR